MNLEAGLKLLNQRLLSAILSKVQVDEYEMSVDESYGHITQTIEAVLADLRKAMESYDILAKSQNVRVKFNVQLNSCIFYVKPEMASLARNLRALPFSRAMDNDEEGTGGSHDSKCCLMCGCFKLPCTLGVRYTISSGRIDEYRLTLTGLGKKNKGRGHRVA